jgi:hypothetical protein
MNAPTVSTAVTHRDRVGWTDLAWVAWRQHRLVLVGTGILVLVGAAAMVVTGLVVDPNVVPPMRSDWIDPGFFTACVTGYGGVVAVFWAAPLLSREYEQRTHLFAWSQDVSAARWLAGQLLLLVAAAVALAIVLGAAGDFMVSQTRSEYAFSMPDFQAVPLVQVGYALFGFALGLVASALTRRTVLSMGLTAAGYIAVRVFVANVWRPYYQTPIRVSEPVGSEGSAMPLSETMRLYVDSGWLDAAGNPVDYPITCMNTSYSEVGQQYDCLRQNGAVSYYSDYQPGDRLGAFRLIEFGIFVALAAALFVLAWRLTRRVRRL